MNNILFQDNLRTAERIEAARKAREEQINKGIFYGSTPSMESDIEKAVQPQALDANGGATDAGDGGNPARGTRRSNSSR